MSRTRSGRTSAVSLEIVNSIASVATLLVIAATAVAALGQLRHSRGSNQIIALTECREVLESETFAAALRFVRRVLPAMMNEPSVRARLLTTPLDEELRPINIVGNFFESMGSFVKHDIIDADIANDLWSGIVVSSWDALSPVLAIMRRSAGPALWENFEYLAAIAQDYTARYPDGTYPKSARHMAVVDVWKDADESLGLIPRQ
jgi:hypothetical protein